MGLAAGIRRYGVAFFCVIWISCMTLCIFTGTRGLPRYFFLQNELKTAHDMDTNYMRQREKLEGKVQKFSSSGLDLDLLEERARTVPNYIEKDEFVIIDDAQES